MDEQAKAILRLLLRTGRGATITSRDLARIMQTSDRILRLGIRELIAEGLPVAAVTSANPGYFVAETIQESRDYAGALKHRIIEDCLRLRDFNRATRPIRQPGQLPLI